MKTTEEIAAPPEGSQIEKGTRLWYRAHKSYCCLDHGCKYDDEDCPVANGETVQDARCEECFGNEVKQGGISKSSSVDDLALAHYENYRPDCNCRSCQAALVQAMIELQNANTLSHLVKELVATRKVVQQLLKALEAGAKPLGEGQ